MGGLFSSQQEIRLVMVGLDNAGKTTILYQCKMGEKVVTAPTIGFNVEVLTYNKLNFTVWDVGGQGTIRSVWRHYYHGVGGVVFVVDSSDKERFSEAAKELRIMYDESAADLNDAFLLILCNKQDMKGAATVGDIRDALGVAAMRPEGKYFLQPTVGTTGEGVNEGFNWLASKLNPQGSSCILS
eukprot:TRINITY_DN12746_c0_g1_i1.p1 TRINITY_DN12746_c0_g1~~TRINITY_DN12746_c0_g1_i1.p1  ORF type:complete len:184 (+),score=30.33 TRINITY_DN12746_c0_g1_i1:119-670(+)